MKKKQPKNTFYDLRGKSRKKEKGKEKEK